MMTLNNNEKMLAFGLCLAFFALTFVIVNMFVITLGLLILAYICIYLSRKWSRFERKAKSKIYCLWASCKKFDPEHPELCLHPDDYIVLDARVAILSLSSAKEKYPNTKFCEDWEED